MAALRRTAARMFVGEKLDLCDDCLLASCRMKPMDRAQAAVHAEKATHMLKTENLTPMCVTAETQKMAPNPETTPAIAAIRLWPEAVA